MKVDIFRKEKLDYNIRETSIKNVRKIYIN